MRVEYTFATFCQIYLKLIRYEGFGFMQRCGFNSFSHQAQDSQSEHLSLLYSLSRRLVNV